MSLPYDLNKTGKSAAALLVLYCAAEVVLIIFNLSLLNFYNEIEFGNLNQGEMDAAAARVDTNGAAVWGLFLLAMIGCYVVAAMWAYRLAANAQAVTPVDNRITPGWTVGWFFVPFANLVMPYRAIRQHWNGLHGVRDMDAAMLGWVLAWWILWLVSNAASTTGTRLNFQADTVDAFRTGTKFDLVASCIAIVAALMFRHLILTLTRKSAEAVPHVPREDVAPLSSIKE